jgi:hypothetical protein
MVSKYIDAYAIYCERNRSCCSICWRYDRLNSSDGCILIHYDVLYSLNKVHVPIAKLSNFWNIMVTSSIQTLVSWYDAVYLSIDCDVLCSLYRVLLHILTICSVRCKISNFWNIATSGIQTLVSWYEFGYLSVHCDVVYSLNKVPLPILNSKLLMVSKYFNGYAIICDWNMSCFAISWRHYRLNSYDGWILIHYAVLCSLYTASLHILDNWNTDMIDITKSDGYTVKVPLHILNTCNTDTRVHCKILLISEIWWQLPVFRCWCRDMILGTFQCTVVFFTVWTKSIFTLWTPATRTPVLLAELSNI